MENFSRPEKEGLFEIKITDTAKAHLLETARWAKFFATFTIILAGLGIIFMIFAALMSGFQQGIPLFLISLVVSIIYIYPIMALYRFAALTKSSLHSGNQAGFEKALWYQKNLYKFVGIMTIVLIGLYGIIIAISIIFASGSL